MAGQLRSNTWCETRSKQAKDEDDIPHTHKMDTHSTTQHHMAPRVHACHTCASAVTSCRPPIRNLRACPSPYASSQRVVESALVRHDQVTSSASNGSSMSRSRLTVLDLVLWLLLGWLMLALSSCRSLPLIPLWLLRLLVLVL